jgi:sialate O-acetylesterase
MLEIPIMKRKIGLLIINIFVLQSILMASVKLPALLSDHVVLQQKSQVLLWGTAKVGNSISIYTSWDKKEYKIKADLKGEFETKVTTPIAGGPYQIKFNDGEDLILNDVLIGEVWICSGQSNMTMPMRGFTKQPILNSDKIIEESSNKQLRFFKVQRAASLNPLNNVEGNWELSSPQTSVAFSAIAYQYGNALQKRLNVPVGLILTAVAGTKIQTWMSKENLSAFPEVKIPLHLDTITEPFKEPSTLYNGMINPLIKYKIKGAIWCQGEANRDDYQIYTQLFSTMVANWRKNWEIGDFPFYYIQTAPLNSRDKKPTVALIREAQLKALALIPNSEMVSTIDIGMEKVIHYTDKTTPAIRLACLALTNTYQIKGANPFSPIYSGMKIDGEKIILSFSNDEDGLNATNPELKLFEIAGEDHIFLPAKAYIKPNGKVEVQNSQIKKPIAVRYAFSNWVVGELFNKNGLPVPSFRTDNWKLIN